MKRALQIILPIAILSVSALLIYLILATKEEPERRRFQPPSPQVVVRPMQQTDFGITLRTQGEVRARTESSLVSEVRGRIVEVAPAFQEGAFFEAGDVLLEIDDRDYRAELTVAQAALAQAELALAQEAARYEQASRDWERLNRGAEASELTLREPQIRQARAAVASAQARVETAQLNLERTKVTAPYAGRILTKNVDVGQYVSMGNELARIYAVDYAEVRLPLTASQVDYLNLPSTYRGEDPTIENGPKVTLTSSTGGRTHSWEGRVVRSEGAVDARTRQLFVVAQVQDPYGETVPGRPPLKVGTFVQAEIEGTVLRDVFVVPRRLFRENSFALVVSDGRLERRSLSVVWENDTQIIVDGGLSDGDLLCLTNVPFALEGLPVVAQLESEARSEAMVAENAPAEAARRPSRPAGGSYADTVITALGDKMPTDLREELVEAKANDDWSRMGPLMRQISEWASANGEQMPPNPQAGSGPRS